MIIDGKGVRFLRGSSVEDFASTGRAASESVQPHISGHSSVISDLSTMRFSQELTISVGGNHKSLGVAMRRPLSGPGELFTLYHFSCGAYCEHSSIELSAFCARVAAVHGATSGIPVLEVWELIGSPNPGGTLDVDMLVAVAQFDNDTHQVVFGVVARNALPSTAVTGYIRGNLSVHRHAGEPVDVYDQRVD